MAANKKLPNRRTIRMQGFDYSRDAYYLFTLVTHDRFPWFGRPASDGKSLVLTLQGEVVHEQWKKTAEIRDHVSLDAFIVMPEHVHGILKFGEPFLPKAGKSLQGYKFDFKNTFSCPVNNLGSTIKGFKGSCTREIRRSCPEFKWVRNYWERVLRSEKELEFYRSYIADNPRKLLESWKRSK